jgi:hypothetical protein
MKRGSASDVGTTESLSLKGGRKKRGSASDLAAAAALGASIALNSVRGKIENIRSTFDGADPTWRPVFTSKGGESEWKDKHGILTLFLDGATQLMEVCRRDKEADEERWAHSRELVESGGLPRNGWEVEMLDGIVKWEAGVQGWQRVPNSLTYVRASERASGASTERMRVWLRRKRRLQDHGRVLLLDSRKKTPVCGESGFEGSGGAAKKATAINTRASAAPGLARAQVRPSATRSGSHGASGGAAKKRRLQDHGLRSAAPAAAEAGHRSCRGRRRAVYITRSWARRVWLAPSMLTLRLRSLAPAQVRQPIPLVLQQSGRWQAAVGQDGDGR